MKQRSRKIMIIIMVAIMLLMTILGGRNTFASYQVEKANLMSKGECGQLLKKDGTIIRVTYVVYQKDGKEYPAYCLDKAKPGVGEVGNYTVDLDGTITSAKVWRAIVNGYPYKTLKELGCSTVQEAFTATKMAVYSMLYDYSIDQFSAIGETGERTLKALEQIVNIARQSSNVKPSSDLIIKEELSQWKLDENNQKYIYKIYGVTSNAPFEKYEVNTKQEQIDGLIISDINNNPRNEFNQKEKFKISLPISQLSDGGKISINVTSQITTKPVFIGKAPNASWQDYAITGMMLEEGNGSKNISYGRNETKLKIYKKDQEKNIPLAGARFDLYNEKKEKVLVDLVSDDLGNIQIKNVMPGRYYLKETKAPDGYFIYEEDIELKIGFNEELSIIVNNRKEEEPEIEIYENQKEVNQNEVKQKPKLPKTGM